MDLSHRIWLDCFGISSIDLILLEMVAYGPLCGLDEHRLIGAIERQVIDEMSQVQAQQLASQALQSLKSRDFVQIITASELHRIQKCVSTDRSRGPFNILPQVGDLEFTLRGAILWQGLERCLWGLCNWTYSTDWEDDLDGVCTRKILGTNCEAVLQMIDDIRCEIDETSIIQVTAPQPIGPWRFSWWQYFENGFLSELTYRVADE